MKLNTSIKNINQIMNISKTKFHKKLFNKKILSGILNNYNNNNNNQKLLNNTNILSYKNYYIKHFTSIENNSNKNNSNSNSNTTTKSNSYYKWGKDLKSDVENFRIEAKKTIDFIAEKHRKLDNERISPSNLEPGFLDNIISDNPPENGKEFKDVLKDIDNNILNNFTFYNHKNFLADTCMNSYPAIIGNFIADAYNNPGVSWVANPAGFELERIVLDWLGDEFDLPENFKKTESGCCVHLDSGESAAVVALAARNKMRLKLNDRSQDDKFCYYYSSQANSSHSKATYIANAKAREIPVVWNSDKRNYEMDFKVLKNKIEEDIKNNLYPTLVFASIGNYSTCAYDNIENIASLCKSNGIWMHVDASILGTKLLLEDSKSKYLKGLDKCNSIVIEGNKSLPFGLDSAFFWVDEAKYVFKALNEDFVLYVQFFKDNQAEMTNYHFGTARATKSIRLWMVIKSFGIEGLKNILRKQVNNLKLLELKLKNEENYNKFKVLTMPLLNILTFTLRNKSNSELKKFVEYVNKEGKILISSGSVNTTSENLRFIKICLNDIYINEKKINNIVSILSMSYNEYFKDN